MATKFEGWLGHSKEAAEGKMEWGSFEPKTWTEDDVDIEISHCGVCGTDLHVLKSEWAPTPYPCCVGHELCGTAVRVGNRVGHIKVGDRVGLGPQSGSCDQSDCNECSSGKPNYCARAVATYGSVYPNGEGKSYGGYAKHNRTNGKWVVKIPDGLASEHAAPMLCAGMTVYTPLKKYGCGPGKKVGVVGVGGLGHFALLFARAMEADKVVAISRSSSKKDDALQLGAHEYIATGEDDEWATKNKRTLDMIIVTASNPTMPMTGYLSMLKVGGVLVQLGVQDEGTFPSFSTIALMFNELSIAGNISGTPDDLKEMLDFAASKNVKPWVQILPMEKANEALLQLEAGKPRFRLVLENTK